MTLSLCGCQDKKETQPRPSTTTQSETPTTSDPKVEIVSYDYFKGEGDGENYAKGSDEIVKLNGKEPYSIYSDNLYLPKGAYEFTFTLKATEGYTAYFEIWDDEDRLIESTIITTGANAIDFTCEDDLYSAQIRFRFSGNGQRITIADFLIQRERSVAIFVDQVGYKPNSRKCAIAKFEQGNYFDIVDKSNGEVVLTVLNSEMVYSEDTKEYVSKFDFSDLEKSGTYYIRSSYGYVSEDFVISNDVYDELYTDALTFFYRQRCGQDVESEDIRHEICHDRSAMIYGTSEAFSPYGGWHDAGDYGRYIETGAKALRDLLGAYIISGDEAILAQARYELEFFLTMQRSDGGVYDKVVTKNYAGEVLPQDDTALLYVISPKSSSTANFISVISTAAKIYEDIDPDFSAELYEAAERSYGYLYRNEYQEEAMPSEFKAGNYNTAAKEYYYYIANMGMWYMSENEDYLKEAFKALSIDEIELHVLYYDPLVLFSSFLYLLEGDEDSSYYKKLDQVFKDQVYALLYELEADPYRISISDYYWGSCGMVLDEAAALIMGHILYEDDALLFGAQEDLDYILGKNSLGRSYVVGYGANYPQNIHHRIAHLLNVEYKGALVGGPDEVKEDPITMTMSEVADQKVYADDYNSYSTNEVSIIYNSALVFVLNYLK